MVTVPTVPSQVPCQQLTDGTEIEQAMMMSDDEDVRCVSLSYHHRLPSHRVSFTFSPVFFQLGHQELTVKRGYLAGMTCGINARRSFLAFYLVLSNFQVSKNLLKITGAGEQGWFYGWPGAVSPGALSHLLIMIIRPQTGSFNPAMYSPYSAWKSSQTLSPHGKKKPCSTPEWSS